MQLQIQIGLQPVLCCSVDRDHEVSACKVHHKPASSHGLEHSKPTDVMSKPNDPMQTQWKNSHSEHFRIWCCRLTLQLVLLLDVYLPCKNSVPQPLGSVKQLSSAADPNRDAAHVSCLDCVQPGAPARPVTFTLASREVNGVLGNVEACHDCTSAAVHDGVAKYRLNLQRQTALLYNASI